MTAVGAGRDLEAPRLKSDDVLWGINVLKECACHLCSAVTLCEVMRHAE